TLRLAAENKGTSPPGSFWVQENSRMPRAGATTPNVNGKNCCVGSLTSTTKCMLGSAAAQNCASPLPNSQSRKPGTFCKTYTSDLFAGLVSVPVLKSSPRAVTSNPPIVLPVALSRKRTPSGATRVTVSIILGWFIPASWCSPAHGFEQHPHRSVRPATQGKRSALYSPRRDVYGASVRPIHWPC